MIIDVEDVPAQNVPLGVDLNWYRNIISDRHLYSPLEGLGSASCRVENRNKPGFSKPGEVR